MCKGGSLNFTTAISAGILGCELFFLPSIHVINGLADNYLYKCSCLKQLEHSTVWWIPSSRIQPLLPHTLGLPWKAVPGPPPTLVSMTNTHRELGARARLLPGPSTFQLFHNLGNVQGNRSEILGPFTPRGFDLWQDLHHKHEAVPRGGRLCLSHFNSRRSTTGSTNKIGKAVEFECWRFNRGEFPRPFTQCNYSNRESSPTGLSSTADMFVAEKSSGIKPTLKTFFSENPFIHKAVPLFYSLINPMNKSKIAILHFSHTSFFPPQKSSKSAAKIAIKILLNDLGEIHFALVSPPGK